MTTRRPHRRAFTLVEASLCTLMASALLVGSLTLVGSRAKASRAFAERIQARALARALLAEITARYYEEPSEAADTFGPSPAEVIAGRSSWDDVDDYDGLTENTIRGRAGKSLAGISGFTRQTSIDFVGSDGARSLTETGLKLITVSVSKDGVELASLTAMRSLAMDDGRARPDGSIIEIDSTVIDEAVPDGDGIVVDLGIVDIRLDLFDN